MSRPSTRVKDAASLAVIEMRKDFGWTQTQLALKLGVAVQTVGRWESYDPPRGPTLERLALFAEEHRYSKAADFRQLMDFERGKHRPLWFGVETEEESKIMIAVLEVIRKPEWAHLRRALIRDLKPVFDAWVFGFTELHRMVEALGTFTEPEAPEAMKVSQKTKGKKDKK